MTSAPKNDREPDPDPMPELCRHDDSSWCNEVCAEMNRKFDEWVKRQKEIARRRLS